MKEGVKKFFNRRRIIILSVIGVLIIAIAVALIIGNLPKSYSFGEAFSLYTARARTGPATEDVTVAPEDMGVHCAPVITDAETSGYAGKSALLDGALAHNAVDFIVNVPEKGDYFIAFDYKILSDPVGEHAIRAEINGALPRAEFGTVPLESLWRNENAEFQQDSLGNDALPMQKQYEGFYRTYLNDYQYKEERGLPVPLEKGDNLIKFTLITGRIYLGKVTVEAITAVTGYEEYRAAYADAAPAYMDGSIVLEAEKPVYKNNISVLAESSKDINVLPYDTYRTKLNTIAGKSAGNTIHYAFTVPADGLYCIALNYANTRANTTAFRKIKIDGETPFGELMHYPFAYTQKYKLETLGNNGDFSFYLEKGPHTLEIEVDGVVMSEIAAPLKEASAELNQLYLDLKKLVGANPDQDRDWVVYDYFPDIVADLERYVRTLEAQKERLMTFNGNDSKNQSTVYIDAAARGLRKLLKKPNKIPNNIALLSEGTSSIVQSVSSAVLEIENGALNIDRIFITAAGRKHDFDRRSGARKFWENVKYFFYTFGGNFKTEKGGEVIEIWANRALQNVSLIQRMADSDFTAKTGVKVRVSMLKDEGKLVLANASGINPDGVIGISNWIPYELGLRDLIYNLNDCEGFPEVMKRFSPGAMLPLVVDGKVLGLPETQEASVLFYRKDILENLGLSVPQTWQDLQKMLPVLQRNGMNFYLPISSTAASKSIAMTAPFIYQNGGSLYTDDGMGAAIDSEKSIEGIKLMTDLYTIYGLPQQVSNFIESFRGGSVPIGIGSLTMYSQLKVSAPELVGLWDVALSPGVRQEDGTIARWQGGGATSCAIMKKSDYPDKVWQFMKWWMSTEVQSAYAQQCRAVWGNQFVWASANVDAFTASPFDDKQKRIILEQWKWVLEIPRVPGWYMIERELSNAWSYIVIDGMNVRAAVDNATLAANKEIKRKLTEFGYIKGDKVLKPYKITTLEDIVNWKG